MFHKERSFTFGRVKFWEGYKTAVLVNKLSKAYRILIYINPGIEHKSWELIILYNLLYRTKLEYFGQFGLSHYWKVVRKLPESILNDKIYMHLVGH